ncbi:uncharacterized protein J8A68_005622 [[Candida] subhashii]|uniref:Uncharacterized protein n=1 Tax=[Candida] subhashii TaxID=561895 RepID=A0A8J5QLM5_9ASCO|nr:uncharacterized protein J8A68_005622 [[Candida] subhashii]KAG7660805.1 hypothetical protein J8A68_005622 [[Candida] subhashii]
MFNSIRSFPRQCSIILSKRFNYVKPSLDLPIDQLRPLYTKFGWYIIPKSDDVSNKYTDLVNEEFDKHNFTKDTPKDSIQEFVSKWYKIYHINEIEGKEKAVALAKAARVASVGTNETFTYYSAKRHEAVTKVGLAFPPDFQQLVERRWNELGSTTRQRIVTTYKQMVGDGYPIVENPQKIGGGKPPTLDRELQKFERRYYLKQSRLSEMQKELDKPDLTMEDVDAQLQQEWKESSTRDKRLFGQRFAKLVTAGKYIEYGKIIPFEERTVEHELIWCMYKGVDLELNETGDVIAVYSIQKPMLIEFYRLEKGLTIEKGRNRFRRLSADELAELEKKARELLLDGKVCYKDKIVDAKEYALEH